MNKTALVIMAICLLAGWSAAAVVRVDNFDSYTNGVVNTVTGGAWTADSAIADTAITILDGTIQIAQATAQQHAAWRSVPDVADGTTSTLFLRFKVSTLTTDQSIGLTDVATSQTGASNTWTDFRAQSTLTNGSLGVRDGGTARSLKTLTVGEWYNLWMVVNNATGTTADTVRLYCNQGTVNATSADLLAVNVSGVMKDTFSFRTGTAGTLNKFYWRGQNAGGVDRIVSVDDVYMMAGTDLTNPAGVMGAHNPTPAHGATNVLTTATLSWYTGVDPSNPANPNPNITKHYVYMREGDPNLTYATYVEVPAGSPVNATASCNSLVTLLEDKTYYWRVDESVSNSSRTDPNTIKGSTWRFDAVKTIPVITQQPTDTVAVVGGTATFTVKATVNGTMHYQWYYSADAIIGGDSPKNIDANSLTISPVARADEGYYYCTIVKQGNEDHPVNTNVVKLGAGRKLAHWTLNQADYVGNQYLDTNLEDAIHHNADPNGIPSFAAGANGTPNGAVTIDPVNGYASAGTWNPSEMTGQFTISLWAKWAGQTTPTTWQGLVSKETSYGSGTMMWQLEVTSAAEASSTVVLKNGLETGNLSTPVLPIGTWEHLAVTFDGTTATVYRNGISAASGTWTMGTKTDAPVNIGISARSLTEKLMFNGTLDDVQIYNYAKTPNEVVDIYHDMSGKSACTHKPTYDFDNDCLVTMSDFAIIASNWLNNGLFTNP